MILSLRSRLLLGTALLMATGLLAAGLLTYATLRSSLVQRVDDQLSAAAPDAASSFLGGPGGAAGDGRGSHQQSGLPSGSYLAVFSSSGTLIGERNVDFHGPGPSTTAVVSRPSLPNPLPNAGPDRPTLLDTGGSGGQRFRVLVESVDRANNDFVVVGIPLAEVQSTLNYLVSLEALIGSLVLLATAGLAFWIIHVGLRPLQRMAATAAAIAAGDLSRRVGPATSQTEIGRLGLALNSMLSQIEDSFKERSRSESRMRRFLADASHELRTPLTSIRGYAELLRRTATLPKDEAEAARRRIEEEAIRMSRLVDDLLLLARLDEGRPLESSPVDLRRITEDAFADVSVTAPGRAIKLDAPVPVVVIGDDLRLRQVVGNLVRNAVVHTPAGTPIEISLSAAAGMAALTVVDHGRGLEEEQLPRLFEPFFRADPGRSRDRGGSGLGLSIASAVAAAHGGSIAAERTAGGGATFRLLLPLTPADGPAQGN